MNTQNKLIFRLEIIWWLVTIILVGGVLFPIFQAIEYYPFLWINVAFIVIFVTLARYIFLLKHTFLAKRQWVKFALTLLCLPLVFWLIGRINHFQTYLDEEGLESFLSILELERQAALGSYIRNEMIFFGVGAIISAVIFPIRMIISFWRTRNRGTV